MTDTVTVVINPESETRREEVTISKDAANVLQSLVELWKVGLVSDDEDVTGYEGYEGEVNVECPATVTFKGRLVSSALEALNK